MQVDLLGVLAVRRGDRVISGAAVGGRRARVVLAALALAEGPVAADRLAELIWGDELPPTWQPALRGVVRALRTALAEIGAGDQAVVATVPAGYVLSRDVEVDTRTVVAAARSAAVMLADGRLQAALAAADVAAGASGGQLLADEDAAWLAPHRAAVDAAAADAAEVRALAASGLGRHGLAVDAARNAALARPLDERAHRTLIRVLDAAGDRAAAVQAYETCRSTLAEQLGIDPSAETIAAYRAAIADQSAAPAARLPVDSGSFVGRGRESSELAATLADPGLATVVGRGGVGKSRLALHAASAVPFDGGRSWVALAGVAENSLVSATVALAVGVAAGVDDPADALVARFAPLGPTLLVLDGCDVVVDGVASLVSTLCSACPALTVLATSRVPLGVEGERLIPLRPLAAPSSDTVSALRENPQVRLLRDRIRDGGAELALDAGNAELVAAVCRRCDGLPLALELAAAQLTAMPVGDLLDQLAEIDVENDDRLRAVMRSSYELLDVDEAAVFRRLAVLDGPVGLSLVRAVVAGSDIAPVRIVRILRELSARAMVSVDRSGPRWRYQQDDDLRRFAGELLVAEGAERRTYDRLADAILSTLPEDPRAAPSAYADEITAALGSLRALLAAGVDARADRSACLEIAFRLHRYWAATGVAEGRFWLSRLLGAGEATPWTRYATYALGYLSYWSGDVADALRDLQAAIEMFGDEPTPYVARAYNYVAGLFDDLDRPADALEYVRRSIEVAEPLGTDLYVAAAMGMGSVLSERGDSSAAEYACAAVERCRQDGSGEQLAALLPTAAMVCWQVGALEDARAYADEARPMHVTSKRIARVVLLSALVGLALHDGDLDAAVDLGTIADDEGTRLGVERELPLVRSLLARAQLGRGDRDGALRTAGSALDAATRIAVYYPVAVALETAALVLVGRAPDARLASLLAAAAGLRRAGDRPPPATLRADVEQLRDRVGTAGDPGWEPAVALARDLLDTALTGAASGVRPVPPTARGTG